MEEILPFLFFIAYILFSVFTSSNKSKKKKQQPLPPVVSQPKPKPAAQKPVNKPQVQPKPVAKPVNKPIFKKRNIPNVNTRQQQPVSKRSTSQQEQKQKKNPFESIFDEVLKEFEVKKPAPRKQKVQPKLYKATAKPKTKSTISRKIEEQKMQQALKVKKKTKIKKKLKTFEFDAVDAVLYTEIFNRKY